MLPRLRFADVLQFSAIPSLDVALDSFRSRLAMTEKEKQLFSAYFRNRGFYLAGVWEKAFVEKIQESISVAIEQGLSAAQWYLEAQRILATFGGKVTLYSGAEWTPQYAMLVFRNAVQASLAAGRYADMFSPDRWEEAPLWQYHAILDDRVRPEHAELDGQVFAKDDEASRHFLPPWDHNAIAADVPVLTNRGDVQAGEVRPGDLVMTHQGRWRAVSAVLHKLVLGKRVRNLLLASGRRLRITDEHPVLTAAPLRWKKGGELQVGDVLFQHRDEVGGREDAQVPDPKDAPPVIHEPGVPLDVVGLSRSRRVALSIDLDGNLLVRESYVHDVPPDGKLRDDVVTTGSEHAEKVLLRWAELRPPDLSHPGRELLAHSRLVQDAHLAVSAGRLGQLAPPVVVLGAAGMVGVDSVGNRHGLTLGPNGYPGLAAPDRERAVREALGTLQIPQAAALLEMVRTDEERKSFGIGESVGNQGSWHATTILSIADEIYGGELVDLSVDDDATYVAAGVIVSNCRCTATDLNRSEMADEGHTLRRISDFAFRPQGDWDVDRLILVPEWWRNRKAA